jgi:anti-anti-sigma regulatory factor
MLRISHIDGMEGATILRLEGNVSGVWVDELRRLAQVTLANGEVLTIDCAGVSFIDLQGRILIRELLSRHVRLTNCSPFLQSQINADSDS